jgi:NAD+ diphosphatase
MQPRNILSGPYLDRSGQLRDDPEWFATALADPHSRYLPVWNSRNLVAGDPPRAAMLPLAAVPGELRNPQDLILLGRFADTRVFTYEITGSEAPPLDAGVRFEELRMIAAALPADEAGLLAYARGMISWRARHHYCGTCGAAMSAAKGGHVLICTNPVCKHEEFPRTDPAIIVLVSDGDRALLGRQASWPPGRYSTIAGFVEIGESLEDAVAREVFEETGIEVDNIAYHSSQPWPFPSSLMLGFTAHARTTQIVRHDDELEDAQWFTRADLASGRPLVPPSVSISFRLIEHWFDSGGGPKLQDILKPASWPAAR